jgi:hypothetical protein
MRSEKEVYEKLEAGPEKGYVLIACLLHLLLWTSPYIVGSMLYVMILTSTTSETVLVPVVFTGMTVC